MSETGGDVGTAKGVVPPGGGGVPGIPPDPAADGADGPTGAGGFAACFRAWI